MLPGVLLAGITDTDVILTVVSSFITIVAGIIIGAIQWLIKKNIKSSEELRSQQTEEIKSVINGQTKTIEKLTLRQEEQSSLIARSLERIEHHQAAHLRAEREQIAIREVLAEHSNRLADHGERLGHVEASVEFLTNRSDRVDRGSKNE